MIRYLQLAHRNPISVTLIGLLMGWSSLFAQDFFLDQQVTAVRETMIRNKLALAEYIWQEQVTVAVKDKVWQQQRSQAQFGPDGNVQRMSLGLPEESASAEKANRGLREWMAEKKERAMRAYAQAIKQLAESYSQPDPDLLRVAHGHGNIKVEAAGPGAMKLLIHDYVKPGDFVTLVFDSQTGEVQTLQASSYLADAKEAVIIDAKFSKLPDGPNHIDEIKAVAKKKSVTVSVRNLDYQPISSER
jgi:hypothetical protein